MKTPPQIKTKKITLFKETSGVVVFIDLSEVRLAKITTPPLWGFLRETPPFLKS